MECRKVKAKLHTSGGFSFAELMLTMVILALMTGMLATGIPVVINTYQRAVDTANAETYLNTTMVALRSRLCVSKPVRNPDNTPVLSKENTPVYEHPQTGYYYFCNSAEGIQIVQYLDIDRRRESSQLLAPSEKGKFVSFFGTFDEYGIFHAATIAYDPDGGFFTIPDLQVTTKDEIDKAQAEHRKPNSFAALDADYIIHTVNP